MWTCFSVIPLSVYRFCSVEAPRNCPAEHFATVFGAKCDLHKLAILKRNWMGILKIPFMFKQLWDEVLYGTQMFCILASVSRTSSQTPNLSSSCLCFPNLCSLFFFNYVLPLHYIIRGRLKKSQKSSHDAEQKCIFPNCESSLMSRRAVI